VEDVCKQVSKLLIMARGHRSKIDVPAAMLYCRLANECLANNQYRKIYGAWPDFQFNHFQKTMSKIKKDTPLKTWDVLESINRETRGSMHNQEVEIGVNVQHVDVVSDLIESAYANLYPKHPLISDPIMDSQSIRREVLENEAKEIRELMLETYISDDLRFVVEGFAYLGISALEDGEQFATEDIVAIALALAHLGKTNDAEELFKAAITNSSDSLSAENLAICHSGLGRIARHRGDLSAATECYNQSLGIHRGVENHSGIASTLCNLGDIAHKSGDGNEADKLYKESLEIAKKIKDRIVESTIISSQADRARLKGDTDVAEKLYRESQAISIETGMFDRQSRNLGSLAQIAKHRGELDKAKELLQQSLEISRENHYRRGEANNLADLAALESTRNNLVEAEGLYDQSLLINREIQHRGGIVACLGGIATIARKNGELDVAENLYKECLHLNKDAKDKRGIAISLASLARLESERKNYEKAETAGTKD